MALGRGRVARAGLATVLTGSLVLTGAIVPLAPVAAACTVSPDTVQVLEDHTTSANVTSNDGCDLIWSVAPASVGAVDVDPLDADHSLLYAPPFDFNGTATNQYTGASGITPGGTTTVTWNVVPVNDHPTGQDPSLTVGPYEEDTTWSGSWLFTTGPENEASQTLHIKSFTNSNPSVAKPHAWIEPEGASWRFHIDVTPVPNAYGSGHFDAVLQDNGGTANGGLDTTTFTVNWSVTPVADYPTARNDYYGTKPGVTKVVAAPGVLGNDTDPDGDPMTADLWAGSPASATSGASLDGASPAPLIPVPTRTNHGTLTLNQDGSFTYVPDPGFSGRDYAMYTASDAMGPSLPAFLDLLVSSTAPKRVSRSPSSGATGVPRDTRPAITFNVPMRASSFTGSTFKLRDTVTGSLVPATVFYDPDRGRARLTPSSLLKGGRTYKVVVTTGVKDVAGNAFAGTSWSFTTSSDTTRPTITGKSPAPGATGVLQDRTVVVSVSSSLRASTVTTATAQVRDYWSGYAVAATVTWDATNRKIRINPTADLTTGRKYTVVISSNIRDKAGNRLYGASWTFTTTDVN